MDGFLPASSVTRRLSDIYSPIFSPATFLSPCESLPGRESVKVGRPNGRRSHTTCRRACCQKGLGLVTRSRHSDRNPKAGAGRGFLDAGAFIVTNRPHNNIECGSRATMALRLDSCRVAAPRRRSLPLETGHCSARADIEQLRFGE